MFSLRWHLHCPVHQNVSQMTAVAVTSFPVCLRTIYSPHSSKHIHFKMQSWTSPPVKIFQCFLTVLEIKTKDPLLSGPALLSSLMPALSTLLARIILLITFHRFECMFPATMRALHMLFPLSGMIFFFPHLPCGSSLLFCLQFKFFKVFYSEKTFWFLTAQTRSDSTLLHIPISSYTFHVVLLL